MIPGARTIRAEPMARLAGHLRTCIYCRLTPEGQPSTCGQRLVMEADLGVVRGARSREEQDET